MYDNNILQVIQNLQKAENKRANNKAKPDKESELY